MCRMLGIVSKDFVREKWIAPFETIAKTGKIRSDMTVPGHCDGWGMVGYLKENFPQYIEREPSSVTEDPALYGKAARFLEHAVSKIAVVHFRKLSVGQAAISNTHPFILRQWVFCHNGTINHSEKIPLTHLKPAGDTDSERFFLYLMEQVGDLPAGERLNALKRALAEFKQRFDHSSLTLLMTDGKFFYAYRESDGRYEDYYTLYTGTVNGARLFASEPVPGLAVDWTPLANGALVAIDCQTPKQLIE